MKYKQLQKQLKNILKMKEKIAESIKAAPEGQLRADMHKGKYPQYYLCTKTGNIFNKKYLKKDNIELIQKLAQKEYDKKFLHALEKQEKAIRYYLKNYQENALLEAYLQLPETKKIIVNPHILPDEQYLKQWMTKTISKINSYPIENGFPTEKGEFVRSKSEKLIADKLFYMSIPYKYEAPLEINANRILFPDFTLLNIKTRKNIYLEHFGMMDNPEYCKKAIEKIELYQSNGIYLGDDLIITMESSTKGINMKHLEQLIEKYVK